MSQKTQKNIVGLKELRENIDEYIAAVNKGRSFVVVRRSEPVFKIVPPADEEGLWETVVDFTKVKKGGIPLSQILSRL